MELQEAKTLALKLMAQHLPNTWHFEWMNSKRAIGQCRSFRFVNAGHLDMLMQVKSVYQLI